MTAVGAAPITFTAAVDIVNKAISTGAALEAAAAQRKQTVEAMHHYLGPTRLNLDISGLKVIHVTGTKGKGSTCCFVESILQHYGVATGLFTSPHLQKMTERIRVGGRPISEQAFSTYTHEVWERLKATESAVEGTGHARMPTFFRLLTLVGLWTFVHERVDTVILEVGIGGRYDATNVVPPPIACGVTSLDYDHTAILGATLPEIAWEKGGIFKPGSRCFSTVQTCEKATEVLRQCAADAAEQLTIVPALEAGVKLGLDGADHQRLNAALAVALCACALKRDAQALLKSQETQAALAAATWPGRCQVVQRQGATFFIDGAHTGASVRTAAGWFAQECAQRSAAAPGRPQRRHLIFNCSHERDAVALLMPLLQLREPVDGSSGGSSAAPGDAGGELAGSSGSGGGGSGGAGAPFFSAVHFVTTDGRPSRMTPATAAELLQSAGVSSVIDWRQHRLSGDTGAADASGDVSDGGAGGDCDVPQWQSTLATVWRSLQVHSCGSSSGALSAITIGSGREIAEQLAAGSDTCDADADVVVFATGSLYVAASVLDGVAWSAD